MKIYLLQSRLLVALIFVPCSEAIWPFNDDGSARAAPTELLPESNPYTCGAQLRLPVNFPANVTIGEVGGLGEPSMPELQVMFPDVDIENMRAEGGAAGGALGAKFRNFRQEALDMYWDDGSDLGMYSGKVPAMGRSATTTYVGHAFKFVGVTSKRLVARLEMRADTTMYLIDPEAGDPTLQAEEYLTAKAEAEYYRKYFQEHGTPWLSMFNRPKPVLNMWPAEQLGQTHKVVSRERYWTGDNDQAGQEVQLNLTVISKGPSGPRVFLIRDLLSPFECDHIVSQSERVIRPSIVGQDGGFKSRTRTSETGWLSRDRTPILSTVHRRFADALGLDEAIVRSAQNAEELQVVRYERGQQYQPHHDFSDAGIVNQRFLTLLIYTSPADEGGYTSFPKAFGGKGLRVRPPKGSGVLFYSMLPDGNGDDLSLHAGEPVTMGRKWVCNLWIWDPKR